MRFGLNDNIIQSIIFILQQHKEVERAVIYGSRAKGNFKPSSDIDLTLMGKHLDIHILNRIANQLDDLLLPVEFDISVYHQIDNAALIEHIQRAGVVLYSES